MQNKLNLFVDIIKKTCGENLQSIILYGSRASDEAIEKYSDYNLLIILNEIKFSDLKMLAPVMQKWIKSNNTPPLLWAMKNFLNSSDVFPIEFLEMKNHHKILYGDNPFEKLNIELVNLRHECEFELKGKFLKLQQGYILTGGKENKVKELLVDSISTFLILFRSIICLAGKIPPPKRLDVLAKISEFININTKPFISLLEIKENPKAAKKCNIENIFEEYIKEIEKVINFVDNHSNPLQ